MTAALLAFWVGGLVGVAGTMGADWPGYESLPPVARSHPWRFGLAVAALVLVWPAGLLLVWQRRIERERQEAEEQAEYERIEATRKPLGSVWCCPACGELNDVPEASSFLVTRVHWLCCKCLEPLSAPAPAWRIDDEDEP